MRIINHHQGNRNISRTDSEIEIMMIILENETTNSRTNQVFHISSSRIAEIKMQTNATRDYTGYCVSKTRVSRAMMPFLGNKNRIDS